VNKFLTYENTNSNIDYFFNQNHFLLLLISLVIIIFFAMYSSRQKLKYQKIFTFCVGVLLIVIESLRIYWRYKYLQYNGESLDFINIVQLDFFTLSLWISLPLIIVGSFLKNKKNHNVFGLSFVFSVAMLGAIITLIYPVGVNTNFEFYHCYNLMFTLLRSLIIMLGIFFALAKWISVTQFLDLWKAIISLLVFLVACFALYYVFGASNNLFYIEYCPLFESLGVHLPFPWHLFVLGAFLFVFQIIIYLPFRINYYVKNKHV